MPLSLFSHCCFMTENISQRQWSCRHKLLLLSNIEILKKKRCSFVFVEFWKHVKNWSKIFLLPIHHLLESRHTVRKYQWQQPYMRIRKSTETEADDDHFSQPDIQYYYRHPKNLWLTYAQTVWQNVITVNQLVYSVWFYSLLTKECKSQRHKLTVWSSPYSTRQKSEDCNMKHRAKVVSSQGSTVEMNKHQ